MTTLEGFFGPYPFADYQLVVTDDELEDPIEAQGMSIFGSNHLDGRRTHERLVVKGGQSLTLDHYLEVLLRKPGALPGATALVQARASGVFTPAHEAFWAAARLS